MKQYRIMLCLFMIVWSFMGFAEGSVQAAYADWVFSGLIGNEKGEQFGYVFEIKREQQMLQIAAVLLDGQTQQVLFQEKAETSLPYPDVLNAQAGNAFVSFNPINETWTFGIKQPDHKGFQFKVDTLQSTNQKEDLLKLRSGLYMQVFPVKELVGHVQLDAKEEQFVTANTAWFRHIWSNAPIESRLEGLLCQFEDGSGMYAVRLQEKTAICGALAGGIKGDGTPLEISQFLSLNFVAPDQWHIRSITPKMHLQLTNLVNDGSSSQIAGFTHDKNHNGFCTLEPEKR